MAKPKLPKPYEGGPRGKSDVAKARKTFKANAAMKAKANAAAYKSDTRAELGASRREPKPVKALPKPPAKSGGKGPLEQVGDFLDSIIPSRKASQVVDRAMDNKTPVIPYTIQNIKAIKKAKP